MDEQPSDLRGCWAAKGPGPSYSRAAICVHAFGGLQLLFISMIRGSRKDCVHIEPCLSPLPSLVHLLGNSIRRPLLAAGLCCRQKLVDNHCGSMSEKVQSHASP